MSPFDLIDLLEGPVYERAPPSSTEQQLLLHAKAQTEFVFRAIDSVPRPEPGQFARWPRKSLVIGPDGDRYELTVTLERFRHPDPDEPLHC